MSDNIKQLNEQVIKAELKDLVKQSVEETLNNLLDQEAAELTNAAKYERSEQCKGYRSGHYTRNLHTSSGNVTLKVPKLKGVPFETAIIECYRRRESSVEETLIEMYLAGVSVRRVEDITEAGVPGFLLALSAISTRKPMDISRHDAIASFPARNIHTSSSMGFTSSAAGVVSTRMWPSS